MERYYQPEIECASRETIKALQDERLVAQVKHVWENVPYYRKKMIEKGVTPDDIKRAAQPVLAHRLTLENALRIRKGAAAEIIDDILDKTAVPTEAIFDSRV